MLTEKKKGFTLLEIVVAMAIFSVCVTMGLGIMSYALEQKMANTTVLSIQDAFSVASATMVEEIKTAKWPDYSLTATDPGWDPNAFIVTPKNAAITNTLTFITGTAGAEYRIRYSLETNVTSGMRILREKDLVTSFTDSSQFTLIETDPVTPFINLPNLKDGSPAVKLNFVNNNGKITIIMGATLTINGQENNIAYVGTAYARNYYVPELPVQTDSAMVTVRGPYDANGVDVTGKLFTNTNYSYSTDTAFSWGPAPYTYLWSDGETTPIATNYFWTTANIPYTPYVVVTDAEGQSYKGYGSSITLINGVKLTVIIKSVDAAGTVTLNPAAGTVTADLPGGVYAANTVVTLTASPKAAYTATLPSWTGDASGTSLTATVNMGTTAKTVTATFTLNTYTLTYNAGANGTISGNTSQTVNYGKDGEEVTAVPNTGYHFVNWNDGVVTAARKDTSVTANMLVVATFATNVSGNITIAAANTNGSVAPTSIANLTYLGSAVTITATANAGYYFVGWAVTVNTSYINITDASEGSTTLTATSSMPQDGTATVTATFATYWTHTGAVLTGYTGPGGAETIPSVLDGVTITSIGMSALDSTAGHLLTSVIIPSSITSIGAYAFSICSGLTSVTIGSGVTSIGSQAFYECTSLTNVIIGSNVASIGASAFDGCTKLTSVTIPASVTSIGGAAFRSCTSLTSFTVVASNAVYSSDANGVLFNKATTTLIQYPNGKAGVYVIPNSVTSIGANAFAYSAGLTSVTIGSGVTSIGGTAFYNCSKLAIANFLGNAPTGTTTVFTSCKAGFYIHYLYATTGWVPPTWYGFPIQTDPFTLTYIPGNGGTITGLTPQALQPGADGTTVTAVPNTGYYFVAWSDSVITAARTDIKVTAAITVTATFNALPTVTISGPGSGKLNTNYTYTATATGGLAPYTYAWASAGGTPTGGTNITFAPAWATTGLQTVSLTITDSLGQIASSAPLGVTISSVPTVTIRASGGAGAFSMIATTRTLIAKTYSRTTGTVYTTKAQWDALFTGVTDTRTWTLPDVGICWKATTDAAPTGAVTPPAPVPAAGATYNGWGAEGYIFIPQDGSYSFCVNSDDGAEVMVNSTIVASCYNPRGAQATYELAIATAPYTTVTPISLTSGWYSFSVKMENGVGGYSAAVGWEKPGEVTYSTIPASNFSSTSNSNAYLYMDMTSVTDYVLQAGDYLEYDVYWPATIPIIKLIAFDFTTSSGGTLRDAGAVDQNGLSAHPAIADLSAYASGRWYHRKIAIPATLIGTTIYNYDIVCEYDGVGTITGAIKDINITNGAGTTRKAIWNDGEAQPTFATHLTSNVAQTFGFTLGTIGVLNTDYTYTPTVTGGMAPYTYAWASTGGSPAVGTASSFTTQWAAPGAKTVTLTIMDSLGQIATSAPFGVTISSVPTVTLAGPTSGILATDYTYTPTVTGGLAPYTYSWTGPHYKVFTSNGTWTPPAGVTFVQVLVVAGGGGGGNNHGGGGGGGGLLYSSAYAVTPGSYSIIVGAGGIGGANGAGGEGSKGSNSSFASLTAIGGGGGGGRINNNVVSEASSGGSGGGGAGTIDGTTGLPGAGAAGTSGQGSSGGNGTSDATAGNAGGGGGAGIAGGNATGTGSGLGISGTGGNGLQSSISGAAIYYAGGGAGGRWATGATGAAGLGGGGAGGASDYTGGSNGGANLGGGGGGGGGGFGNGGNGGAGVVILQYSTCTNSTLTTQWLTAGAKTVALTVTDSLGQTADATPFGVTIYAAPVVTITGPTSGKLNTPYTYTTTITGGVAPYAYNWTGTYSKTFTSSGSWTVPAGVTSVQVLVVAGGGGAGGAQNSSSAGGDGGKVIQNSSFAVTPGNSIPVVVGTGGIGGNWGNSSTSGKASSFGTIIAAEGKGSPSKAYIGEPLTAGGTGGNGVGAGGAAGHWQVGVFSAITGTNTEYGSAHNNQGLNLGNGQNGAANTGQGGYGVWSNPNVYGGNGGSGVVIILYSGNITTSVAFNSSGTWTVPAGVTSVQVLVVAGGGGGGSRHGGGGGGGGFVETTVAVVSLQGYSIVVGNGGTGSNNGAIGNNTSINGNNSSAFGVIAVGGGAGESNIVGNTGACGGGGGGTNATSGPGCLGGAGSQGYNGGAGWNNGSLWRGGGGGGEGSVGQDSSISTLGAGGIGKTSVITGSVYAAGGNGGSYPDATQGIAGAANTGNGGGGAGGEVNAGGSGGCGIVILQYSSCTTSTLTTQWLTTGAKTVALTITDALLQTASANLGVMISSVPTVTISGPTSGKLATDYTYAPTIIGGAAPYNYAWAGPCYKVFTSNGTWTVPAGVTSVQVLVVGGGGGGTSGGGGGGGVIYNSAYSVNPLANINVVVGGGGNGGIAEQNGGNPGTNGGNSQFDALTAIGGGHGGTNDNVGSANSGGSGGGGGSTSTVQTNGGAGTSGQGNAGGTVTSSYFTSPYASAGGGGAGAGGNPPSSTTSSGNGGIGRAVDVTGTSTYYAGGGGGGTWSNGTHGTGGVGGGGTGAYPNGGAGIVNTGGGGGGGCGGGGGTGGNGGSGIVIIQYSVSTTSATFTSSGTWTVPAGVTSVQVLVVAGGGGGGGSTAGGGGGGGVIYNSNYSVTPGAITVTVGAGGLGSIRSDQGVANNTNGGNSGFGTLTAIGGGYGFSGYASNSRVASNGGSGGGAGYFSGNDILISAPGSGTAGQGYSGGIVTANDNWGGAGGGGAGGAGSPNTNPSSTRNGGIGVQSGISGTSKYYGGGGGGGVFLTDSVSPGGLGGGGNGGSGDPTIPQAGVANTGGGGGGGGYYQFGPGGGAGGSGIVIIRYSTGGITSAITTQWLTAGAKTVALTVTDSLGQTADATPLGVTIYSAPTVTISGSTSVAATPNMLSNVTNSFNYWGTTTGVSEYFTAPNGHQGVHLNLTACNGGVNWYNSGGQVTALASTVYTVSAIIKYTGIPSANLFYLRQYRADGSQVGEGGQYSSSNQVSLGNGWYRASATFTTASDCTSLLIHGYEYYVNETWIYDLQCEQGAGYTYNPVVSGGKAPYTYAWASAETVMNDPTVFTSANEYAMKDLTTIASAHLGQTVTFSADVKSAIPGQVNIYALGGYKINCGTTVASTTTYQRITMTGFFSYVAGDGNGNVCNLSFYGGYGSGVIPTVRNVEVDVVDAANTGASLTAQWPTPGAKIVSLTVTDALVQTGSATLPVTASTAVYFPLAVNAKDTTGTISPSTELNTSYYNGAVWVGQATTNLYNSVFNIYNNYGVPATMTTLPSETYLGQPIYHESMTPTAGAIASFQTEGGSHGVYGNGMTFLANTPYAVSVYWRPISNADTHVSLCASNIGGWTDITTELLPNGWRRSSAFYAAQATAKSDTMFFSFWAPSLTLGSTHVMDWTCPQLEAGRTFVTPFVVGTRGAGVLKYSPSVLGLNLNTSNWTIGCFVKPIPSLMATTGARYNPLEIGNYYTAGSTSITMFHEGIANDYYGNIYDGNTGRWAPGALGLNATDMTGWIFVCFRWDGTTLSMSAVGKSSGLKTTTCTKTWTTPIADLINVGGYGWEAGNHYVRDVVVASRSMTDTELLAMYNAQP